MNEFKEINPPERKRIYIFPECELELENVCKISISNSGTHRLETTDGMKHIVPVGWVCISLEIDEWSF